MITAEQRTARKNFLGASDVAAVLGLDPFRTPADVYLSKTADLIDEPGDAAQLGNHFERPILQWAEKRIGELEYDLPTCYREGTVLCANLDARRKLTGSPVEAKLTALGDGWGDADTDQVPERVLVQTTVQLICNPADEAFVSAFLAGCRSVADALRIYRIPFNAELARIIIDETGQWWDKHVVAGVMPDSAPSMETVKRIKRQPGKVVPLDPAIAKAYLAAKAVKSNAEKLEKEARARLEAALAGADAGDCPGYTVEFKDVAVKEYMVDARVDRRLTCKAAK